MWKCNVLSLSAILFTGGSPVRPLPIIPLFSHFETHGTSLAITIHVANSPALALAPYPHHLTIQETSCSWLQPLPYPLDMFIVVQLDIMVQAAPPLS